MSYESSCDRPHQPGAGPLWQESDCYWFYDAANGVGGFHRIGQKPNVGRGQKTLFVFKQGGQRFVLSAGDAVDVAIAPDDRGEDWHRVAGHEAVALGEGRMRFTWQEDGCTGDVEFYESFYPPRDWSRSGHSAGFMKNLNADGHLECSGRLRGSVTIGDARYDIDALCHRDRSWGFRDSARASLHRYRMYSGTVGPELSFASFVLDLKDGPRMAAGFVVRDGVDLDVRDLRVVTTFDSDGITPLSARTTFTLETGEQLQVESRSVQGFLTPVPEVQCATQDHISTLEFGGKTGFVDLELCANPGRGSYIPLQSDVTFTAVDQGLSDSVDYRL